MLALVASALPASAQSAGARPEVAGFVESGGRLVHFRVVRDSVVVFGQGGRRQGEHEEKRTHGCGRRTSAS